MVGVPGRSKACLTCRKRRVACDGVQPNCGQCLNSNRICQGYDRFPIFINRTTSGLERRQPLEEAKPRATNTASPVDAPVILPQHVHAVAAWDDQLLSQFLEKYGGLSQPTLGAPMPAWLHASAQVASPNTPLRLSLRAVATTRIGRLSNDTILLENGIKIYCQALQELQKALWHSERMWEDETLMAAKILLLYEVFESTSHSLQAWNSHVSGVTRLILLRGPHLHQSPMSIATVEEHRYLAMIQSLHFRKRNPLATPKWRSGQLGAGQYFNFSSLYDLGFDVGALAEDMDLSLDSLMDKHTTLTANSLLKRCEALECKLQAWYEEFSKETLGPTFWEAPELLPDKGEDGNVALEVPIAFRSMAIAELLTTFWAIRLLLTVALLKIHSTVSESRAQSTMSQQATLSDSNQQNVESRTSSQPILAPSSRLPVSIPLPTYLRDLAILITRSATFCLSESAGQHGPLRFLFPLRVALITFQNTAAILKDRNGAEDASVVAAERYREWCQGFYEMLEKEKQIGYARDLGKHPSQWQRRET